MMVKGERKCIREFGKGWWHSIVAATGTSEERLQVGRAGFEKLEIRELAELCSVGGFCDQQGNGMRVDMSKLIQ